MGNNFRVASPVSNHVGGSPHFPGSNVPHAIAGAVPHTPGISLPHVAGGGFQHQFGVGSPRFAGGESHNIPGDFPHSFREHWVHFGPHERGPICERGPIFVNRFVPVPSVPGNSGNSGNTISNGSGVVVNGSNNTVTNNVTTTVTNNNSAPANPFPFGGFNFPVLPQISLPSFPTVPYPPLPAPYSAQPGTNQPGAPPLSGQILQDNTNNPGGNDFVYQTNDGYTIELNPLTNGPHNTVRITDPNGNVLVEDYRGEQVTPNQPQPQQVQNQNGIRTIYVGGNTAVSIARGANGEPYSVKIFDKSTGTEMWRGFKTDHTLDGTGTFASAAQAASDFSQLSNQNPASFASGTLTSLPSAPWALSTPSGYAPGVPGGVPGFPQPSPYTAPAQTGGSFTTNSPSQMTYSTQRGYKINVNSDGSLAITDGSSPAKMLLTLDKDGKEILPYGAQQTGAKLGGSVRSFVLPDGTAVTWMAPDKQGNIAGVGAKMAVKIFDPYSKAEQVLTVGTDGKIMGSNTDTTDTKDYKKALQWAYDQNNIAYLTPSGMTDTIPPDFLTAFQGLVHSADKPADPKPVSSQSDPSPAVAPKNDPPPANKPAPAPAASTSAPAKQAPANPPPPTTQSSNDTEDSKLLKKMKPGDLNPSGDSKQIAYKTDSGYLVNVYEDADGTRHVNFTDPTKMTTMALKSSKGDSTGHIIINDEAKKAGWLPSISSWTGTHEFHFNDDPSGNGAPSTLIRVTTADNGLDRVYILDKNAGKEIELAFNSDGTVASYKVSPSSDANQFPASSDDHAHPVDRHEE